MNTKLDETMLACWLEDELQGVELAAFEAAMGGNQELLARREAVRAWRQMIQGALPAAEEPPYPDFFNNRIEQALRQSPQRAVGDRPRTGAWRAWWLPATALVGMTLTFWLGTMASRPPVVVAVPNPVPHPVVVATPVVYTPEGGVAAEWFSSDQAAATVIVLEGLEAIPDTLDFSETVQLSSDEQSTAGTADINDRRARQ